MDEGEKKKETVVSFIGLRDEQGDPEAGALVITSRESTVEVLASLDVVCAVDPKSRDIRFRSSAT